MGTVCRVGNAAGEQGREMRKARLFFFSIGNKLQWLTTFSSVLLIPVILRAFALQQIKVSALTVDLLIIFLVMLAMATLASLSGAISREVDRSRVTVTFHYKTALQESDSAIYDPILHRLSRAKESVKILGSLRSPESNSSKARERYYELIEHIVQQKILGGNKFVYERIVQLSDDTALGNQEDLRSATTLTASRVDELTFDHCRRVMELTRNAGRVKFLPSQVRAILPVITLIIIDDEYIILCLPWVDMEGSTRAVDTQQLGKGLFFHDREGREGAFSGEMHSLFTTIVPLGQPILSLHDDRASRPEL